MQPWEEVRPDPRDAMIADMQRVMKLSPTVTRNFYRAHGRFRERDWQYIWATFKEFVRAAKIHERD